MSLVTLCLMELDGTSREVRWKDAPPEFLMPVVPSLCDKPLMPRLPAIDVPKPARYRRVSADCTLNYAMYERVVEL